MKLFVKEYEDCLRQVFVNFEIGEVNKAYEEAFLSIQKKAQFPGYRVGKVPFDIIEKNFSDDLMNEIIRSMVVQTADRLHADGVYLYSEPRFKPFKNLSKDQPFSFSLVFEVVPRVVQNIDIDNLVLEYDEYYFDDKMVDQTIQKDISSLETVKGKIEEDDTVTIQVLNDGYKGEKEAVLSSKIVRALTGKKTGDKVKLDFNDLDSYVADFMGNTDNDVIEAEITKVERPAAQNLTDDLVKEVSPFKTAEEYRDSVKKRFEQTITGLNGMNKKNSLASFFAGNAKVQFPKSEFLRSSKEEINKFIENNFYITEISLKNLISESKIREDFSGLLDRTYENIVFYFATKEIAEKNSIKPDQALIDRIARSHAKEHDQSLDEFKQKSSREEWENVLEAAKMDAALQFLMNKAQFKSKAKLPLIKTK